MTGMPGAPDERLPNERVMLGGATVMLSVLPIGMGLLVAPAPLAVLVLRYGLASGIWVAVLSGLLASLLLRSPLIMAQVLLTLALGIALGEALREKFPLRWIIVVGSGVVLLTTALLMALIQRVFGMGLLDIIATLWQEALSLSPGSDMSEELIQRSIAAMRMTLPASMLIGSVGLTVFDYGLTRWLDRRLPGSDKSAPALPAFGRWRFPRWLAAVYVVGRLLEAVFWSWLGGPVQILWINGMLIASFLVALQGVAVAWFWLERAKVKKALRWLIIGGAYLFLEPIASVLFLLVGLLDSWLDFRKVRKSNV